MVCFGGVVMVIVGLMVSAEGARMMITKHENEQQQQQQQQQQQSSLHPQNFIAAGGFIPTTPGTPGFATGFGFGPSGFCTFPGSCIPGSSGGGSISSSSGAAAVGVGVGVGVGSPP